MPPVCPDGFDHSIWEEIEKIPLNDTFLLELAAELKKRNCCVDDICGCLCLDKSVIKVQSEDGYDQHHAILTEWQHSAHKQNKSSVRDLMDCLSRLPNMSKILSDFCSTFFKLKGIT